MSEALVDPDLAGQAAHGRPGFAPYDLTIASPELPCGVSWLASCLLELGLPLWRPWGINDRSSWQALGARRHRYRFPGSGWSRLVPGLVDGRTFRLQPSPVPRFTHAWPGQLPATPRLILFVRDPRDALHSDWQRQRRIAALAPEVGFDTFIGSPQPGLPLSRAEYLGLHLQAWRGNAVDGTVRVLRFEDAKADPVRALREVLDFIGLRCSARAIAHAVRASDHAAVVQAEQQLLAAGTVPTPILGRGRPFGYRERAQPIAVDQRLADACRWLGYAPPDVVGENRALDRTALLQALLQPGCADPARLTACIDAALAR